MTLKKQVLLAVTTVGVIATAAIAAVELVETSTKTSGATTITWDSSFQDLDYTLGDIVAFSVIWTVDEGAAEYSDFTLKKVTPRGRDPAEGVLISATPDGNVVDVQFKFTELHLSEKEGVEIGTAHFKLHLIIDKDGDGVPESNAKYGVNLHVEDPL